jgi:hypothetical protein
MSAWLIGTVPLQLVVQKHLFTNPKENVTLEVQFEWDGGNNTIVKVSEIGTRMVPIWDCSKPELNITIQVSWTQISIACHIISYSCCCLHPQFVKKKRNE